MRDFGVDSEQAASVSHNIGVTMLHQDRYDEALTHARAALTYYEKAPTPGGLRTANAHEMVARAHRGLGTHHEALASYNKALELRLAQLGPAHKIIKGTLELINELCTQDHYAPACQ